ncbi:MAG: ABC-F family ATP-binding cassette domain-containing protein [Acidimicrobiaceae bacterium]|nr:ABC-F family ATP-binding cassette domain-containing protein [Acidimicrobiaceae bacterium]
MLTASNLGMSFGARRLFKDVTLELRPGRRIALVGGNGAGKTTLIGMLMGEIEPDEGAVHRPSNLQLGYLPQDLADDPQGTVLEEAMAGDERMQAARTRLAELEERLTSSTGDDPKLIQDYSDAQGHFDQLGGYSAEADAHRVLAGLGFKGTDGDKPLRELSGGWRMRAALARLLVAKPDVLILDEPTNHLDVDSVAWLERQLAAWPSALLFVSHDRDFIDAVAERVVELSGGTTNEYIGGFAEFVVGREERIAAIEAAAAGQARKVAQVEKFVERFRYKATKARQVQSRIKTLEKLDKIEVPTRESIKAKFGFPEPQRSARIVVELENVTAGYDGKAIVSNVNLVVERGSKVAFIGPNGAGKTTLVKMMLGELEPMAGTVTIGNNVDIATFAQHQTEVLVESRSPFEELSATMGDLGMRNSRTILGSFGFSGEAADRKIGDLSGGERTRLALAKTMVHPVNLLVLDEPTNHLDLPSCDLLEDALQAYPGTVILVTHDRHLIRNVAEILVEVRDGKVTVHDEVDERLLMPGENTIPAKLSTSLTGKAKKSAKKTDTRSSSGRKQEKRGQAEERNEHHQNTKSLRIELRKVEKDWEKAEAKVVAVHAKLADPAVYDDGAQVALLAKQVDSAKDLAAKLSARWEELASKLERFNN